MHHPTRRGVHMDVERPTVAWQVRPGDHVIVMDGLWVALTVTRAAVATLRNGQPRLMWLCRYYTRALAVPPDALVVVELPEERAEWEEQLAVWDAQREAVAR